jgi:hypothetical protein
LKSTLSEDGQSEDSFLWNSGQIQKKPHFCVNQQNRQILPIKLSNSVHIAKFGVQNRFRPHPSGNMGILNNSVKSKALQFERRYGEA